jgi:hypothetical protein
MSIVGYVALAVLAYVAFCAMWCRICGMSPTKDTETSIDARDLSNKRKLFGPPYPARRDRSFRSIPS